MARPRKNIDKLINVQGLITPQRLEDIDILASRCAVTRSEIVRQALDALIDANPVDELERARWHKERAEGRLTGLRRPTGTVARLVNVASTEKPTSGIEPLTYGLRNRTRPTVSRSTHKYAA